jgi:hypothetical protein
MDRSRNDRVTSVLRALPWLVTCALAGPIVVSAAPADTTAPPEVSRVLARRLAASGRAEVPIVRRQQDPMTGAAREAHGRLVLEPPDRARISFKSTGEQITLRDDGGEWLQPQLEQMLRFDGARALAGLRWWTLFGRRTGEAFDARRTGSRTWEVRMHATAGAPDSARVELDAAGLPHRIAFEEVGSGTVEYELGAWTFSRPRGRKDFVLHAPPGYDTFDMP